MSFIKVRLLHVLIVFTFFAILAVNSVTVQAADQQGSGKLLSGEAPYQTSHPVKTVKIVPETNLPQAATSQKASLETPRPRPRPLPIAPTSPVKANPAAASPETTPPASGNPSNIGLFKNTVVSSVAPFGWRSTNHEPAAAEAGQNIFYTANWYAAYSTNGGTSFNYVNPATAFPDVPGLAGFCCDQDTIYDASRDLMIWNLMYEPNSNGNIMRLAYTKGANLAANSWSYIDLAPEDIAGFTPNAWFDYPHLALSNNYVYITANVYVGTVSNSSYVGTQIIRIPLGQLASGGLVTKTDRYFGKLDTITPVQGATSTMYFGMHDLTKPTSQLTLFSWPESGNVSTINLNHAVSTAIASTLQTYQCASPGGLDACQSSDNRILAAWLGKGRIGFMWDDPQGTGGLGTFPYPYIHTLIIDEASKTVSSENAIWNSNTAFFYPSASTNLRGDVGGTFGWSGGSFFPSAGIFVWDNGSSLVPLESRFIASGTDAPKTNRWGDYLRTRRSSSNAYEWVGTAYTLQGGNNIGAAESRYLRFGRNTDEGNPPPPPPTSSALVYYALPKPIRLIDTRTTPGTIARFPGGGPIQAGATKTYSIAGIAFDGITIPAAARAIEGNTQVAEPTAAGYLTAYPANSPQPVVATMLYNAGQFLANEVTLTLDLTSGAISIFSFQTTDILLDVTGYYAPPGTPDPNNANRTDTGLVYYPLPQPIRLIDTRNSPGTVAKFPGGGPIKAGTVQSYNVSNLNFQGVTIPATAKALVGNTQVALPPGAGYLTLYPGNLTQPPSVATILYNPNQYLANALTLTLGPNGAINVYSSLTTEMLLDVTGYYAPPGTADPNNFSTGLSYYPLSSPIRLIDTRSPSQAYYNGIGAIAAGGTISRQVANLTYLGVNIPTTARALVGNIQVAAPTNAGFLTAYPGSSSLPTVASLLYNPGQFLANAVVVTLGSNSTISLYSFQATEALLDVTGYFA